LRVYFVIVSMAASQTMCVIMVLSLFGRTSASAFLRKDISAMMADTHLNLLEELEGVLGEAHRQATERRMVRLEDALRPTIAAMPKSSDGKLEHVAVRYVLHRLFVEKHGWYVRGLAPNGETWNSSSPIAMLQDKTPHAIFENHLGKHTFGLHEIAVLAATLENLVHDETIARLRSAFTSHQFVADDATLTEEQMGEVIDTYMIHYVMGTFDSTESPKQIRESVLEVYPKWPETAKFVHDIRREVLDRSDANPYSLNFNDTMKVVEEIGERYGRWQDRECHELKHDLLKLENQGTGRVLLKDFYGAAAEGAWQFSESVKYLRELGALDESDPARLKVIIANYINAPTNCVASSSFYSVCCIDECETLRGQLERTVAAPEATPEQITKIISTLPSPTVDAPRDISASLRNLLNEIAVHHKNSKIPLHSRLFSQFLHHAYPRECSFPHVTGTTRPRTVEEWMDENGPDSVAATEEEMKQHIENVAPHKEEDGLPWIAEEELFCAQPPIAGTSANRSHWRSVGRSIACVAALLCLSLMFFRNVASTKISKSTNPNKFYV